MIYSIHYRFVVAIVAALVCSASAVMAGELVVFGKGARPLKIVVPAAATDAEKDAASELRNFLNKASGKSFEIATEEKSSTGLFIGRTKLAAQWGLPAKDPKDESFDIRVDSAKKQAVIVGQIDMSTKFAVYNFLDRFAGVRWFLPGELFQVVPKRDRLAIKDCSIHESSALSGRTLGYSLAGDMYPSEPDPQFGSPLVDYSDPKAVRIDTSRRGGHASRWAFRNLFSVDGRLEASFQGHNFIRILNYASYFKEHPEYYPPRYSLPGAAPLAGYGWQPCTSNPGVLQVTLDWGRDFFKRNPEHWAWFSLGINDSGGWCECENCRALDVPRGQFRGDNIVTDRYLKFVKQVAEVMLKEFPDRKIGLIAYNTVVLPPLTIDKLPPNVKVVITRDSFQYHDPAYLAEDIANDKKWLEVTNGNLYRYDYYSLGWMVPRYFPHRMAEDIRRMRDLGIKGVYSEDVPLWPTVGPSYYLASKLWWNPDLDVDKLIKEFTTTLYGPAAAPMSRYWERHERVWLKKRPGKWFEGLGNMNAQASMFSLEDLKYLDQQLDRARRLAGPNELIRKRIDFVEGGWRLAEYYIREYHLIRQLQAAKSPEAASKAAQQLLAAVQARHAYWAKYREEPRFPGQGGPCEDYRFVIETLHHLDEWEQSHQSTLAMVAARVASQSPETYQSLLDHFKTAKAPAEFIKPIEDAAALANLKQAPNLVRNPSFELGDGNQHPSGLDWITEGAPQHWAQWKHITGSFSFDNGIARIHGTNNGVWIQQFSVTPGEVLVGSVEYRLRADQPAKAKLAVIWKDKTGAWLGSYKTDGFNADSLGRADDWQEVFCRHVVPGGAAFAVFELGAENLEPDAVVEFRNPAFRKPGNGP